MSQTTIDLRLLGNFSDLVFPLSASKCRVLFDRSLGYTYSLASKIRSLSRIENLEKSTRQKVARNKAGTPAETLMYYVTRSSVGNFYNYKAQPNFLICPDTGTVQSVLFVAEFN